MILGIHDAKLLIGKICSISWLDRNGNEIHTISQVYDAAYVPLYGGYLMTEGDDVRLDRITDVQVIVEQPSTPFELPAAA